MTAISPRENADQAFFDFLVPVTKELLRVDEVMTILRLEKDAVYALCDAGKLEAHKDAGKNSHIKITRRSVVAHLAATAKYATSDFPETLLTLIKGLPEAQRASLIAKLTR